MSEKIYCFHTSRLEVVKRGYAPAATVVLKKVGTGIVYGISICSKEDNFSRKFGRTIAEERMNQNFGSFDNSKMRVDLSDHEQCLFHMRNLAISVVSKNRKWRSKIDQFNKASKP